ncbi:zinc finger protein 665-like [Palaemon carinicauda]|uniref:zinc finger protein 665-like n=1 Tax=Palaemon carinicauda TaxID=392227 RepID=UPI0035B65CCE
MEDLSPHINGLEEDDLVYLDYYLDSVYNVSPDFKDLPSIWSPLSQELNECPSETCMDIVPSLQSLQSDVDDDENYEEDSLQSIHPVRKNRGIPSERFVSYKSFPAVRGKPYPCKICGINLRTKESSKRHILSKHIKERRHLCNVCGKTFVFKFSLNAHSAIHEKTPRHVCVCGVSFKLRASYMSHVRRIHQAASEIKFQCELCFKSFRDRHTLRLHMTSVHKPKTIPCKAKGCDKVFSSLSLMRCHYRYHLNQKFTCDKCGQSFSTESYLQKHILSHSGVRPYTCVDCGKTFLSASHRNQHRRMRHSPVKLYQCSFCGKRFKTKDLMTYHENNHRGEKPFKCEICGYATAYKNTYYAHRKKHLTAKNSNTPETESAAPSAKRTRGSRKNEVSESKDKCKKNILIKPKLTSTKNQQISSSSSKHEYLPNVCGSKVQVISPMPFSSSSSSSPSSRTTCIAKQVNVNFNIFPHSIISDPDFCDTAQSMKSTDSDAKIYMVKDSLGGDGRHVKGSNNISLKECTNKQTISVSEKNDCSIILSNNGRCSISECKSVDDTLLLIKIGDNSFAGVCSNHSLSEDTEISEINLNSLENLTLTAVDSKCLGSDLTSENVLNVCSPTPSSNPVQNFIASLNDQKLFMASSKSDISLIDINSIDQSKTLLMTECSEADDILLPLDQLENIKSSSGVHCDVNVEPAEIDVGMPSLSSHIDDSFHLAHMEVVCRLCDEQFFCMDTYITHLESIHK